MELDTGWLLLGLPAAFVLGWLASRLDLRQLRIENRQSPNAYFRGLNFLLNEQQDQAIDAFIEAVQSDPDTSELHFALGNLFRRRGEYDRAVRVHEHLLARADLPQRDRDRAQHALALDFLKAGLLDRAEDALRRLEGTAHEQEARLALLAIYERSRDWRQAADMARRLEAAGMGSFSGRLAHYLCEQASQAMAGGDIDAARARLHEAIDAAPESARPWMDLAQLAAGAGRHQEAFDALTELARRHPAALPLCASALLTSAQGCGRLDEARALLQTHQTQSPSLDLADALAGLEPAGSPAARHHHLRYLAQEPSLVAASRWLAGQLPAGPDTGDSAFDAPALVQRALDHAARPLMRYRCAACGFEARQHFWQCPGCQAWDSFPARRVEEL